MRISSQTIKQLCRKKGKTLSRMLSEAGVSRNAYYSLAREDSILPGSLHSIADYLGVQPVEILTAEDHRLEAARLLRAEVDEIVGAHKGIDRDNVRHSLILLGEEPIERLRRALRRGQRADIRRG